jgi:hypothetical protein
VLPTTIADIHAHQTESPLSWSFLYYYNNNFPCFQTAEQKKHSFVVSTDKYSLAGERGSKGNVLSERGKRGERGNWGERSKTPRFKIEIGELRET